jgi:hypothetical protein
MSYLCVICMSTGCASFPLNPSDRNKNSSYRIGFPRRARLTLLWSIRQSEQDLALLNRLSLGRTRLPRRARLTFLGQSAEQDLAVSNKTGLPALCNIGGLVKCAPISLYELRRPGDGASGTYGKQNAEPNLSNQEWAIAGAAA